MKRSRSHHVNISFQSAFYHEMKMHCHEQVIIFLSCPTQDKQVPESTVEVTCQC